MGSSSKSMQQSSKTRSKEVTAAAAATMWMGMMQTIWLQQLLMQWRLHSLQHLSSQKSHHRRGQHRPGSSSSSKL
jgi:hypothetical protein